MSDFQLSRVGMLALVLLLPHAASAAGPRGPLYQPTPWVPRRLAGEEVRTISARLPKLLKKLKIKEPRVSIEGDHVHSRACNGEGLAEPGLAAIWALSTTKMGQGEVDFLYPDGTRQVPVSVFREGSVLSVALGPATDLRPRGDVDGSTIVARYGIEAVRDGEARWTPAERVLLDRALATLDERELRAIRGVPFVRNTRQHRRLKVPHAAWYEMDPGGRARIVVLDGAFGHTESGFVGSPTAPEPPSSLVVLHEVGHALTRAALVEKLGSLVVSGRELDAAAAQSGARIADFEAEGAAADRERKTLERRLAEHEAWREGLNRGTEAQNRRVNAYSKGSAEYKAEVERRNARAVELKATQEPGGKAEIEGWDLRLAATRDLILAERDAIDAAVATHGAELTRYAEAHAALARDLDGLAEEDRARNQRIASHNSEATEENTEVERHNAGVLEAERLAESVPLLVAYAALPGARKGPTAYGATEIGEGFAESFALYRLDPAALGRVAPEILRWFDSGEYLRFLPH